MISSIALFNLVDGILESFENRVLAAVEVERRPEGFGLEIEVISIGLNADFDCGEASLWRMGEGRGARVPNEILGKVCGV
jgi:hypothetical protein